MSADQDDRSDLGPKLQNAMQLIAALCDERITPEQFAELESLVCTDREIRKFYVEMIHLHAGLYYFAPAMLDMVDSPIRLDEDPSDGMPGLAMSETMVVPALKEPVGVQEPEEFAPPGPIATFSPPPKSGLNPYFIKGAIAAAVTLIFGLLAYFVPSMNSPSGDAYNAPIVAPPWYVADIESTAKPVWETAPRHGGSFIAGESLVLKSGAVQLRLRHSGRLVVEGPVDIRFISDAEFRINQGRIVATFPGGGLVVRCPTGSIDDLGTQFGVAVDPGTGSTEVEVFQGKVAASLSSSATTQPSPPVILKVGQAAVLSENAVTSSVGGAVPQRYICNLQNQQIDMLDVTDLLSGGDGTTHRRGIAIDALTGDIGVLTPAGLRSGDGKYHPVRGFPVIDGTFVPDGSKGPSTVDSAGHQFRFPATSNWVINQIWTGGEIPWPDALGISTSFSGEDYSTSNHSIICTHANNAVTLDLEAIRRLYPDRVLTRFHCHFGNSYINGLKGAIKRNPVAGVYVLVDGVSRFQKPSFSNQDGLFPVDIPLAKTDRFLTLSAVDDGKEIDRDWILWADAKLDVAPAN